MSPYLISPNFHTLLSQGLSPLVHYFLDHSNNSVHTDVNLFLEEDRRLVLVGLVLGAVCSVLLMFNCFLLGVKKGSQQMNITGIISSVCREKAWIVLALLHFALWLVWESCTTFSRRGPFPWLREGIQPVRPACFRLWNKRGRAEKTNRRASNRETSLFYVSDLSCLRRSTLHSANETDS